MKIYLHDAWHMKKMVAMPIYGMNTKTSSVQIQWAELDNFGTKH